MSDYTTTSPQLEEYAETLKLPLLGVISKDQLQGKIMIGSYIINLEDSDAGNGTHWVLLKVMPQGIIYFDSFGLPPPKPVRQYIGKHKLASSNRQIQNVDGTTCGLFCLGCDHYLTHNLKRKDIYERFDDWLNMFKVNTKENDKILLDYLRKNGLNL
jgi:hypothetical protein